MAEPFRQLSKEVAVEHGLNPDLVYAMIQVESGCNQWSLRFEPRWRWFLSPKTWSKILNISEMTEHVCQQMSWGLMQVMGGVAREHGFDDLLSKLMIPKVGIDYGCRHLKKMLDRYGNLPDAVMAYNAGHPGTGLGHAYLTKVMDAMQKLERMS